MHTTASSLVAITQYFWRIRTSLIYGNQQKFNIEAVNDYPPIWLEIRFERNFPIRRSIVKDIDIDVVDVFSQKYRYHIDVSRRYWPTFNIQYTLYMVHYGLMVNSFFWFG